MSFCIPTLSPRLAHAGSLMTHREKPEEHCPARRSCHPQICLPKQIFYQQRGFPVHRGIGINLRHNAVYSHLYRRHIHFPKKCQHCVCIASGRAFYNYLICCGHCAYLVTDAGKELRNRSRRHRPVGGGGGNCWAIRAAISGTV